MANSPRYQSTGHGRFCKCVCCGEKIDSFVDSFRLFHVSGVPVGFQCGCCIQIELDEQLWDDTLVSNSFDEVCHVNLC